MSSESPDNPTIDDSRESLVALAVDQFLERAGEGEQPDVEEFARRYPDIADMLRDMLPAVQAMHESDLLQASTDSDTISTDEGGCLGDYRILREIGRGGMGIVYEAEQISLHRRVALKVLPFAAALDPRRLERFKNEAQAAAKLHHSNIVPVYAVGCERGVYYFAMQMIEGASLADIIGQLKRWSEPTMAETVQQTSPDASDVLDDYLASASDTAPSAKHDETQASAWATYSTVGTKNASAHCRAVAKLGIQAAEALDHAHDLDVVHRDIKPANLLVDARGNLWVTDFGLARLQGDGELTMTGDVVGTYRYMSPEQALGKNSVVDHRTDIYSLGATLYELLTLAPVYEGSCHQELLVSITSRDPVPPRRVNRSIPTDLETIVLKAMAKEPEGRYATAHELAEDLRCFLDNRPISAKRPTVMERTAKWSRRHKTVVASAVIVLLLAVIGLAVSNVLVAHERAKTHAAYEEAAKKRDETAAALDKEAKQRAAAERNFQRARDMLDFVVQVSVEGLADIEEAQVTRSKLLQASLDYYDDFIQQSSDNPPLQAELAASHFRVARILDQIGSTTAAKSAMEKALEAQERLVRENPHDQDLRRSLFGMYYESGVLWGFVSLHVVAKESVQQHLKLSADQIAKIDEISEDRQRVFRKFCESKSTDLARMRKEFLEHREDSKEAIAQTLSPDQRKRLNQLVLQHRGAAALGDSAVADELGLTVIQREKIASILKEPRFHSPWKGPGRPRTHTQTLKERAERVLTPAQQEEWKQMIGEPFDDVKRRSFGDSFPGNRGWPSGRKPRRGPR